MNHHLRFGLLAALAVVLSGCHDATPVPYAAGLPLHEIARLHEHLEMGVMERLVFLGQPNNSCEGLCTPQPRPRPVAPAPTMSQAVPGIEPPEQLSLGV